MAFEIKDEATYYWLGVLFADGSGTEWNRIILKSKHLDFIREFSIYVNKLVVRGVGARTPVYRVDFSDAEMRQRLIDLGWTRERKDRRVIPELPLGMVRHFLRGYFDGDGSIHKDKRKLNCWRIEWAAHPVTSSTIKNILEMNCPAANVRLYHRGTSDQLLIYNVEGVHQIIRYLYKDVTVCPHPKIKAESVQSLVEGILR